jgi:hypothetical protein
MNRRRFGDTGGVRAKARQWIISAVVATFAMAYADSIKVNGVAYEKVYVVESPAMYYVNVPATGETMAVLKEQTSDVAISPNAEERKGLLKEFQKKTQRRVPFKLAKVSTEKQPTPPPKPVQQAKLAPAPPALSPAQDPPNRKFGFLTNRSQAALRADHERRVFESKSGVFVLTNMPEHYQDSDAYIERSLRFEPIKVPERFRVAGARPIYLNLPGAAGVKEIVEYYAKQYNLPSSLVYGVIRQESNFNPMAVSPAGARGLMQLMPTTALEMGVSNIFDPAENIAGGAQYLRKMLDFTGGKEDLALAAYNAGPGNVQRYGFQIPPFPETRDYVRVVRAFKEQYAEKLPGEIQLAEAQPVDPSFLPGEHKGQFEVVLTNGLTQPADEVPRSPQHGGEEPSQRSAQGGLSDHGKRTPRHSCSTPTRRNAFEGAGTYPDRPGL